MLPDRAASSDEWQRCQKANFHQLNVNALLEVCRKNLGATRKGGLSFMDAYGTDPVLTEQMREHLAPVWQHGRVVWGSIVKANARLYEEGEDSQLGYVVFHPGDGSVTQPEDLQFLSFWIRNLGLEDSEPEIARFAEIVADDYAHVSNEPLPARVAFGHEVYFTRALLLRAGFPNRRIESRLVPLLIWPEGSPDCCLLPGSLWAEGLLSASQGLEARAAGELTSPPWRPPPTLRAAYPQDPDYVWESLRGTRGQPPRLAKHALAGIRRTFREQGFNPAEWFVWLTLNEETDAPGLRRALKFRRFGAPPPAGCHCRQEEFTLVWHPDQAAWFDGCVIQLEDNWMVGPWYRFAVPPPPVLPVVWIKLPGIASAEERGRLVEDPLADFLEEHGLGEIVDAGTQWTGAEAPKSTNAESRIGIETAEPDRLVGMLVPFLARLGVPPGTHLESKGERLPV